MGSERKKMQTERDAGPSIKKSALHHSRGRSKSSQMHRSMHRIHRFKTARLQMLLQHPKQRAATGAPAYNLQARMSWTRFF